MKQNLVPSAPQAGICINKSRLKLYHKDTTPTYYLENGQEFSIELHNPTSNTVLAKIQLNGKEISQSGLVLRPGERVFLERYFDIARKFKFETYEISNTLSNMEAIKDNGGMKVSFYNEKIIPPYVPIPTYPPVLLTPWPSNPYIYYGGINSNPIVGQCNSSLNAGDSYGNYFNSTAGAASASYTTTTTNAGFSSSNSFDASAKAAAMKRSLNKVSLDSMSDTLRSNRPASLNSNKVETGRVEAGQASGQAFEYVSKQFESWAFHTVEYKLLPLSQRVNTVDDIQVKRYCGNCGKKSVKTDKFCSQCGRSL